MIFPISRRRKWKGLSSEAKEEEARVEWKERERHWCPIEFLFFLVGNSFHVIFQWNRLLWNFRLLLFLQVGASHPHRENREKPRSRTKEKSEWSAVRWDEEKSERHDLPLKVGEGSEFCWKRERKRKYRQSSNCLNSFSTSHFLMFCSLDSTTMQRLYFLVVLLQFFSQLSAQYIFLLLPFQRFTLKPKEGSCASLCCLCLIRGQLKKWLWREVVSSTQLSLSTTHWHSFSVPQVSRNIFT